MTGRILKLVISILFYAVHKLIQVFYTVTGREISPILVILTYHPVKKQDTASFERQMNMLLNIGSPVFLNGDIPALHRGYNIAVTFDDAYQSVLENALPILSRKGIPATIFVPTGCLGKKPAWISNPEHKYADETVLNEEQLKTLPYDFISIGSHTVNHTNLLKTDETTARKEIFDSKQYLEKTLNREITMFAAPYATLNEKFTDLFKQAGYNRVFLNIPTFTANKTDLYILGRTSVEPTDWNIEYYLKLTGSYQWLPLAVSVKKKLLGRNGI
jgi:peptidoglycan/xylan/chitin deacetylase (PgdA/CDA1 family)